MSIFLAISSKTVDRFFTRRSVARGMAAALTLLATAGVAHAQWTVRYLQPNLPAGSDGSLAFAGYGAYQGGTSLEAGSAGRAGMWNGTAASWFDMHPSGVSESTILGMSATQQVGSVFVNPRPTGGAETAAIWTGTAGSYQSLHPSGASSSRAWAASGTQQAGAAFFQTLHAGLWNGTAASWVDLHPTSANSSEAFDIAGGQQVGQSRIAGVAHASVWTGSAASWIDLHPAGASSSGARATNGTQQGGYAYIAGFPHASLWNGSPQSWVDLQPALAVSSEIEGLFGGQQVGSTEMGGIYRASLWSGTAQSWLDLGAFVSADYSDTYALSMWSDGPLTYIDGYGYNVVNNRFEALLWVVPAPGTLGLLIPTGILAVRRSRRLPA